MRKVSTLSESVHLDLIHVKTNWRRFLRESEKVKKELRKARKYNLAQKLTAIEGEVAKDILGCIVETSMIRAKKLVRNAYSILRDIKKEAGTATHKTAATKRASLVVIHGGNQAAA